MFVIFYNHIIIINSIQNIKIYNFKSINRGRVTFSFIDNSKNKYVCEKIYSIIGPIAKLFREKYCDTLVSEFCRI